MELKDFLEKQDKLDKYIVDNQIKSGNMKQIHHNSNMFLGDRLHALMVEVSELSNATRCFKYWSTKEPETKERILDELADVIHFLASVINTLRFTAKETEEAYHKKYKENIRRQEEGY